MPFDFPASPTEGQEFTPAGGPTYVFASPVWLVKGALPPDAPYDANAYGRKSGLWVDVAEEAPVNVIDAYARNNGGWLKLARQLSNSTTFYVRNDGNDNNTGLTNDAAGAWKTIQGAIWNVRRMSGDGLTAYLAVQAGTYNESVIVDGPCSLAINIQGVGSTVLWNGASGQPCLQVKNGAKVTMYGVSVQASGSGPSCLQATDDGVIELWSTMYCRGAPSAYAEAVNNGHIISQGRSLTISGNVGAVFKAYNSGYVDCNGTFVTFSGSPTISFAFVHAGGMGQVFAANLMASGTIGGTAPKFIIENGGGIFCNGNPDRRSFPGNAPGVITGYASFFEAVSAREVMTGARTWNVSPSGDDTTGDGSAGYPWKTIAKAINYIIQNVDTRGNACTVQLAQGTYPETVTITAPPVGGGGILIQGGSSEVQASSYVWQGQVNCLNLGGAGGLYLTVKGITLSPGAAGRGISVYAPHTCYVQYCVLTGPRAGGTLNASDSGYALAAYAPGAFLVVNGNNYISANANNVHFYVAWGAVMSVTGTITFTVAVTASWFMYIETGGVLRTQNTTWVNPGNLTASKYNVISGGGLDTAGGGVAALPGSSAGTVDAASGGWSR